jgi:hypothetical protein
MYDADVLWFPFDETPPKAFGSSGEYFPPMWNKHVLSRFMLTFD